MEERPLQPRRERSTAWIVLSCLTIGYVGALIGFFLGMMAASALHVHEELLSGFCGAIVCFAGGVCLPLWIKAGHNQPILSPPPAPPRRPSLERILGIFCFSGCGAFVGFLTAIALLFFSLAGTWIPPDAEPDEGMGMLWFFLGMIGVIGVIPGALAGAGLGLWMMSGPERGEDSAPGAPGSSR